MHWLAGTLHASLLIEAFEAEASDQQSLRTRYGYDKAANPAQFVMLPEAFTLPFEEANVASISEVDFIMHDELKTPIILEDGVFRIVVVHVAGTQLTLVAINTHHISTDDSSQELLWKQLDNKYTALATGSTFELGAPPEIQYCDYAVWQRRCYNNGTVLKEELKWWCETLGGDPPLLELQPDMNRPGMLSGKGGWSTVQIVDAQGLRSLCQQNRATPVHAILALWSILLCKHSGQPSIVVGIPTRNRPDKQLERVLGYFVNTLPVQLEIPQDQHQNFTDTILNTATAVLGALQHGQTPFVKIVKAVGSAAVELDSSRTPLFQNMFAWFEEQAGVSSQLALDDSLSGLVDAGLDLIRSLDVTVWLL